jgi:iron complex transport system substrate-binding protein
VVNPYRTLAVNLFGLAYIIYLDPNTNRTVNEFKAGSTDGKFAVTIPANTVIAGNNNNITGAITSNATASPEGTVFISPVYHFEPGGMTFTPPITITYAYDLTQYPAVGEDLIYFSYFDDQAGNWVEVPDGVTINRTQHTVTAPISHFSEYALLGHTTRTITDMYGTELTVPAVIKHVLSGGPVETQLIYMLAPDKLCAVNGTIAGIGGWKTTSSFWYNSWNGTAPYVPAQYLDQALGGPLPDIGNGSSSDSVLNWEVIAALNPAPDIILEGKTKNISDYRKKTSVPVVGVNAGDSLCWDFAQEVTFVGSLLGVPDKAAQLLSFYTGTMDYVSSKVGSFRGTSTNETDSALKIRVYYAENGDGLSTDAKGSWHTNLLWFCGGANVAAVQAQNTNKMVQVNMEQILTWEEADPIDMIIIGRSAVLPGTYNDIMASGSIWQVLDCVKKGAVYIKPGNPTSWFDGPPGYGQIIGMYWLVHLLYPNLCYDLDLSAKVKEFYANFLHYDLTDAQVAELLSQPTIP